MAVWVKVTRTVGHCAKVGEGSTEYFDADLYGRYRVERFASIMRKRMGDTSVVCLSVEYVTKRYLVEVDQLENIAIETSEGR